MAISVNYSSFFIVTFDGNLMVPSERSSSDLSEYTLFQIFDGENRKIFASDKSRESRPHKAGAWT